MSSYPVDVAVLGSCATRDNFNSRFNADYKDVVRCVLTQHQSSLISLMAEPTGLAGEALGDLDDHDTWTVRSDFTKEFLLLREAAPAYVVVDLFADLHFGVLDLGGGQYVSNNRWKLWKTPYYRALAQSGGLRALEIDRDPAAYVALWRRSADAFVDFVRREVPGCEVLVHKARNADVYLSADGDLRRLSTSGKVKNVDVARLNALWDELDSHLEVGHGLRCIDMTDQLLVSYDEHPWGAFYVHYTPDYYPTFLERLQSLVEQERAPARAGQIT
jgi:hypothetical protein